MGKGWANDNPVCPPYGMMIGCHGIDGILRRGRRTFSRWSRTAAVPSGVTRMSGRHCALRFKPSANTIPSLSMRGYSCPTICTVSGPGRRTMRISHCGGIKSNAGSLVLVRPVCIARTGWHPLKSAIGNRPCGNAAIGSISTTIRSNMTGFNNRWIGRIRPFIASSLRVFIRRIGPWLNLTHGYCPELKWMKPVRRREIKGARLEWFLHRPGGTDRPAGHPLRPPGRRGTG